MRKRPWGAVQGTPGTPSSMRTEPAVVPRRLLAITAAMALILSLMAVNAVPAFGGPGGNDEQGHVKIHEGPGEPSPEVRNEPKVCTFHVHGFNFHAGEEIVWEIRAKGDRGWQDGAVVLTGASTADSDGEWRDPDAGAYDLPDGHYKLFVDRVDRPGGPMKHKVFKVECEEEVAPIVEVATTTTTTAPTTTTTTAPTTTTTAAPTTTTAGQGGAQLALTVEKSATQNGVTLDATTSATSNEAILFMVTITNSSSNEVEITDIDDSVFGELEGDADCDVGTELAEAASCSFTFEKTLNVDLTTDQLEGLVEDETHTNVVTVLGVDVETSADVMGEAALTFPVVVTDVLGIIITAPTTTAPGADAEAGAVTDEVLSAQVEAEQLPFTGIATDRLIGLAIMLLGGGALLLRGTARREES